MNKLLNLTCRGWKRYGSVSNYLSPKSRLINYTIPYFPVFTIEEIGKQAIQITINLVLQRKRTALSDKDFSKKFNAQNTTH